MKFRFLFSALIFSTLLFSCTPKFSQTARDQTNATWTKTELLYSKIISGPDRNYDSYANDYKTIDLDIAALQEIDRTRPKSKTIVKILTDIQNRFDTYENEHKAAGNINTSQARAYKYGMDALWKELYNTENHLNK